MPVILPRHHSNPSPKSRINVGKYALRIDYLLLKPMYLCNCIENQRLIGACLGDRKEAPSARSWKAVPKEVGKSTDHLHRIASVAWMVGELDKPLKIANFPFERSPQ